MAVLDDVYGDAPNAIDRVYEPAPTDALDDVFGADDAPPSGSAIDDVFGDDEGEIKNAPASWGDVLGFFGKMGSGPMAVDERALDFIAKGGLEGGAKAPEILTPQEKEAALGTVVPAGIVGGSLLVGGPGAGLAAREALGLTTGALSRAAIAKSRDQDMTDAVFDPSGIAIDATLSATPEIWAGAKAVGRGIKAVTPEAVAAPVRAAAAPVRAGIDRAREAGRAGLDKFADLVAKRYPRFGAQLVAEGAQAPGLSDLFDRPPLPELDETLLQTTPINQGREPVRGLLAKLVAGMWSGPTRTLLASDDPIAQLGGQMLQRARQLDDSAQALAGPRLEQALGAVPRDQADDVVKLLEGGAAAPEAQGGKRRVLQVAAQLIRDLLDEVNQLREGRVYDRVGATRAGELLDQGDQVWAAAGSRPKFFAPARRAEFFFPHMAESAGDAPVRQGVERYMAEGMTAEQAMRRLHGTTSGRTTGFSRTADWQGYSRDPFDVVPRYVNRELTTAVNAEVFGGKPVALAIETPHGTEDMLVGEKAAQVYKHLLNTGQHENARQFGMALVDRYGGKIAGENEAARWAARKASDMALGHSALTQVGQAATPIWASGGPTQLARGRSMVNANPVLKDLFEAGPSRTSFVDYATLGREDMARTGGLMTPMEAMSGIEHWLRGPQSYAAVAMIDDVAQEAKAVSDAGGQFSAALVKRAAEMGTTPQDLAAELARDGMLSPQRWLDSIQSLVNRWQYTTGPGDVGHLLRTPTGALLAQYKTYGIKATQHVLDDVLGPLASNDPSLKALGRQRLRDLMVYGGPANALASATRAVAKGRAPSIANMATAAFTGPTGVAGDVTRSVVDAATPEYGDSPIADLLQVPAASIPARALDRTFGGIGKGDPLLAAEGATTLLGAYDPRIPMYLSGPLRVAREMNR